MPLFTISINQFVEASKATDRGKARIVRQQLNVNTLRTQWYQLAKHRIKLYFKDVTNFSVLRNAIRELNNRVPKDQKDKTNITVSVEALNRVIAMRFDNILVNGYQVLSVPEKSIEIGNINININPELIFRYEEDGLTKIGALKFHVSKSKPFDLAQSKHIANLVKIFLEKKVAQPGEIVDENLCWSYDIFADRLTHADAAVITEQMAKDLCDELRIIHSKLP